MCLPYPLPSHRPACGCQESGFLTVPPPRTLARASVHCQGRSLFRPLGSPGGTGGSASSFEGNNFISKSDIVSQERLKLTGGWARAQPSGAAQCYRPPYYKSPSHDGY